MRRCARPRPMSAPLSPRPTRSRSAPATARCIIFTSGGKFRRRATERAAEPLPFSRRRGQERNVMLKSVVLPGAAVTLAAAALLLPLRGQEALAQDGQAFVNVVDLEITPASMPRFLAALKDDGAGTIKEAGTQEFVSSVEQKDKNHVFIFEVFNDAAAWDAHQKTATYANFLALTMMMIKTYAIRPFAS